MIRMQIMKSPSIRPEGSPAALQIIDTGSALIPLACLPELRLTNRGLVDCRSFRFVDLFEDDAT